MPETPPYDIDLDVQYGVLQFLDLPAIAAAFGDGWTNRTLCRVNDCVVRLASIQGDFHWHTHEKEDEFFLTISGTLLVDVYDRTVELGPNQAFTVPKGVHHRTRAPGRTVILMVEGGSVSPEGD